MVWNLAILDIYQKFLVSKEPHTIWDTDSILYQLWAPKWCIFWVQVTVAFNKDPSPIKVNLGVGAYRTEVCVKK